MDLVDCRGTHGLPCTKQVKKEIENYFYFYNYVRINERLGMSPMEYYYRHKEDDSLISDLHNKEYSNIYDLIEFVEGSSSAVEISID